MNMFTSIKKLFSKDLILDTQKASGIVYSFGINHLIKIGSDVVVPNGYSFVLGHSGKAMDMFNEGTYQLNAATLPECCKKLKIHKPDKKGKLVKNFKADVYFVNLDKFSYSFKTFEKAELGSRASGIFTVGVKGNFTCTVSDPKIFVEKLLYEFAYVKNGESEKILISWVEDIILAILRKYNFALSEFLSNNEIIKTNLETELAIKLNKFGVKLISLDEPYYILPKKYQKKYEKNLSESKCNEQCEETLQGDSLKVDNDEGSITAMNDSNATENLSSLDVPVTESVVKTPNNQEIEMKRVEVYVPFGDFVIDNSDSSNSDKIETNVDTEKKEVVDRENNSSPIEESDNEKQKDDSSEFVDLNLNNLYKKDYSVKICKNCGAENSSESTICELCGYKL